MRKFAGLTLTALFLLVFVAGSFAAQRVIDQSTVANANATGTLMEEHATVPNELDEPVVIFNFELDNLDEWTWGNNRTQDSYWSTSDYTPHGGAACWRPFNAEYGNNGGYANTWLQTAMTPALDLTATTNPELSFWFKLNCEAAGGEPTGYDAWDGANFMIRYTDENDEVVTEVVTEFTGTAYNGTSYFSYGFEWYMGTGVPGWNGVIDWTEITMDLSDYIAYDDVQILFTFCSDPGYDTASPAPNGDPTMSGLQLDDIAIVDGETTLFADDAEDPENSTFIFFGGLDETVPSEFSLLDGQTDAPSPSKVLDVNNVARGYSHYMESPEFTLPTLGEGEQLFFDLWVNSEMAYDAALTYYASWECEIWDPEQETWWNVNNIRNLNASSSYVGPSSGWSSVTTDFGSAVWEATPLAGLEGVKTRIIFNSAAGAYDFTFCRWDNFTYEIRGVQHDIATQILSIPYPVAVGLPNPGTVQYTNQGVDTETFIAFWGVGVANIPGIPGPSIELASGETALMTIDTPNNATTGWVPTAAQAGTTVNLIARASLSTDEDNSNDYDTTAVYVNNAGEYEFGYDNHTIAWFYTMNNANTGPMTRFVMDQTNPYFSDVALDLTDIGVYWYSDPDTRANWPTGGIPFRVHVYEGGDTPGAELLNQEVTVSLAGGNLGWALVDISGIESLQGSTAADFYVWTEFYTLVNDGTVDVIQPSILADENNTGDLYPSNNLYYDGETVTEAGYASFIHVLAAESETSADEPVIGVIPGEFALDAAYPNPFNPTTTLRYDVARTGQVSLKVFNVMGQEVASLVDRQVQAGSHMITFDASSLTSGVYFVRMQADGFSAVRKVMLMK